MSDDTIVSLSDVTVEFGSPGLLDPLRGRTESGVRAVDAVSLEIESNDVVALVGESGCGKTTLGKTAVGLQRPTDGTVSYRGQDIWATRDGDSSATIPFEEIRHSLQIVHQDPGSSLNGNRTVLSSLGDPLRRWQPELSAEQREATIYQVLERVGLTPVETYATRFPHQLSGGERQRIALGRALLVQPDLVLADEAVSALDVSLRIEMMDLMLELQSTVETSFLFVSHDLANARYLTERAGGRIGVMYLGKLVEIGTPTEIIESPQHPYTKLLRWATPELDPSLARKAKAETPPVRSIDVPDPTSLPSGCRFHPRCPKMLPPETVEIDQKAYNEVLDVRERLDDGELSEPAALLATDDPTQQGLYDELFSVELGGQNREVVERALCAVLDDEPEQASELLRKRFESICERSEPALPDGDHPVACHLETSESATDSSDGRTDGGAPED
ncbi:ABC transporter ATP-binding protein [Halocatena halophila]|uniref:ABC transporter ATP-binding protein n=1 Tax=Halocatena halophila TaxID=2814576 RepID=UPI002ED67159